LYHFDCLVLYCCDIQRFSF